MGGNHLPNVSAAHSDLLSSTRPVEYSWNCTQRTPGLEAQFAAGDDIREAEATFRRQGLAGRSGLLGPWE